MVQLLLRNIRLNPNTGYYEATEAASKYQIDKSLIDNLAKYLTDNPTQLIADWHRSLSDKETDNVKKTSIYG